LSVPSSAASTSRTRIAATPSANTAMTATMMTVVRFIPAKVISVMELLK
jgi:hypothetical protein